MAVTLVAAMSLNTTSNASTNVLTTISFTPTVGELIIVKGVLENSVNKLDNPTISGGGITWTKQYEASAGGSCGAAIWSGIVTIGGSSMTISMQMVSGASVSWWSAVVERWTGAQLDASPAIGFLVGSSTTTTMTTLGTGSYISYLDGDWNAQTPGTPVYASGAVQENIHDKSAAAVYVAYYAYQTAPTAGSQTFGLTLPSSRIDTLIGIEIRAIPTVVTSHNLVLLGVGF